MFKVAIAGERGLVSRALQEQLKSLPQVEFLVVPTEVALTLGGAEQLSKADLAVLAVQDFASPDIVARMAPSARILDISPAFRTQSDWVYGLPELPGNTKKIAGALRVANPGCFATSAILIIAPLARVNMLSKSQPIYLDAVGGYSTGGRAMEEKALSGDLPAEAVYSLTKEHRHVAEIITYGGVTGPLWFQPKIASFKRGIRMQIAVPGVFRNEVLSVLKKAYEGTAIQVSNENPSKIAANEWAHKKGACIRVYEQASGCLVICTMDNLGKGAVDSAFDNLKLMLGLS